MTQELGKKYKNKQTGEVVQHVKSLNIPIAEGALCFLRKDGKYMFISVDAAFMLFEVWQSDTKHAEGCTCCACKEFPVETNSIDSQKEENLSEKEKELAEKGYRFPRTANWLREQGFNIEKEKPTSIWKDVSELPENPKDLALGDKYLIKNKSKIKLAEVNSNKLFSVGGGLSHGYAWIEKFCTLTDFINEHIQLKEDVEELKKLIKKE